MLWRFRFSTGESAPLSGVPSLSSFAGAVFPLNSQITQNYRVFLKAMARPICAAAHRRLLVTLVELWRWIPGVLSTIGCPREARNYTERYIEEPLGSKKLQKFAFGRLTRAGFSAADPSLGESFTE